MSTKSLSSHHSIRKSIERENTINKITVILNKTYFKLCIQGALHIF